jgi:predicted DsbA family dithiol-disulfide isomerase
MERMLLAFPPAMKIEVWSDVVCPWCYVGKRRLEHALERFPHRDAVEVTWRSFELDPSAPAQRTESTIEHLANKYGISHQQAEAANQRVSGVAAQEGLAFRLDQAKSGNTFDAHRLIHLAAQHGLQDAAKERLMAAYFTEGEPIGDRETLVRLASEVGLDADEVRGVLESDAFADAVQSDESEARALGITGVPFFVLDRKYGISGAQPSDLILQALQQAWAEANPLTMVTAAGGEDVVCTDETCVVPPAVSKAAS